MKKLLIGLVIAVIILAGASTLFVVSKLDEVIADAIRTEGSEAVGSAVTVDSVVTKLKDGTATINKLAIANPAGYQTAHALIIDSFTAEVDYQTQVINKIVIDKPTINAEIIDLKKNNFQDILDNMPPDEPEEPLAEGEEELELTIKSLQLTNTTVNVINKQLGKRSFEMNGLTMNNLNGTADQISEEITRRLTNHVSAQVKNYAKQELGKLLKNEATKQAKELVNKEIEKKLGEDVTGKIKGLKSLKLKLK